MAQTIGRISAIATNQMIGSGDGQRQATLVRFEAARHHPVFSRHLEVCFRFLCNGNLTLTLLILFAGFALCLLSLSLSRPRLAFCLGSLLLRSSFSLQTRLFFLSSCLSNATLILLSRSFGSRLLALQLFLTFLCRLGSRSLTLGLSLLTRLLACHLFGNQFVNALVQLCLLALLFLYECGYDLLLFLQLVHLFLLLRLLALLRPAPVDRPHTRE